MMTESEKISGKFVEHWEVPRFAVQVGTRFLGLLPRIEKWQAIFPPGFALPASVQPTKDRPPPRCFKMVVSGTVSPQGHFGHNGICRRQITVSEVLSCEETTDFTHTW